MPQFRSLLCTLGFIFSTPDPIDGPASTPCVAVVELPDPGFRPRTTIATPPRGRVIGVTRTDSRDEAREIALRQNAQRLAVRRLRFWSIALDRPPAIGETIGS